MKKRVLFFAFILIATSRLFGQEYENQNQPTIDFERLHFGFSIGLNTQNLLFTHVDQSASANQYYAEVPNLNPGFSVGLVTDYCLGRYFNLRTTPAIHFGSKDVEIMDWSTKKSITQELKSNYIYLPLELKYSSLRLNNTRPYLMVGAAASYDLSRKGGDTEYLRLNPLDYYLEVGVGCDIYYNYFKLNPELKFCFGLNNVLDTERTDIETPISGGADPKRFTKALSKAASRLIVLTFYFE
ncbi:MAG: porin family protein [Bacteroidales bacterium]